MTLLTSSHFILSIRGVSKCVLHAPGSLIKCRGSLVVRPPGMPECLQNLRDFMLPEADSHKHPSKSTPAKADDIQNSPDCIFRIHQSYCTDFSFPELKASSMFPCHARFIFIFIQQEVSLLTKACNEELHNLLVHQKQLTLGSGQDSLSCCQNHAHAACCVCV